MKPETKSLTLELAIVTSILLFVSHVLFAMRGISWVKEWIATIVAILFLYVPVVVIWKRGRKIDFIDLNFKPLLNSVITFIVAALIVFPLFLLAAHFWQLIVFKKVSFHFAQFPNFLNVTVFQLLLISLPEEFYFRGYFQSTIDKIFKNKKRFLGVDLGAGWIITAAVFAFAHTIVYYQWWHFAIFFPALLFGYLRLRTGSITAPILFHAASNVLMDWFSRCYS